MIPILGAGARSSVANFWPQLDNYGGGGGSLRDEGVGSVNSDITEVNSSGCRILHARTWEIQIQCKEKDER